MSAFMSAFEPRCGSIRVKLSQAGAGSEVNAGMVVCWKAESGEELWKERLGGDFFASPVMMGDRIYASNEASSY